MTISIDWCLLILLLFGVWFGFIDFFFALVVFLAFQTFFLLLGYLVVNVVNKALKFKLEELKRKRS